MIEHEKYLISKKMFQKVKRLKLTMRDRKRLRLLRYESYLNISQDACMVILFEGVLGYLQNNINNDKITLFVRPGYVQFLEQVAKHFLVSIVFPHHYKTEMIIEILDQLAASEIQLYQIYKCFLKPKFFGHIYDMEPIINDFLRVSNSAMD